MNEAVSRQELYQLNKVAHSQAMGSLVKNVRLRRAAQQQAAAFKAELAAIKGGLKAALQQVEVLQACAAYGNDGKCLDGLCVKSRIRLHCV